jgi:hypothetical protein
MIIRQIDVGFTPEAVCSEILTHSSESFQKNTVQFYHACQHTYVFFSKIQGESDTMDIDKKDNYLEIKPFPMGKGRKWIVIRIETSDL